MERNGGRESASGMAEGPRRSAQTRSRVSKPPRPRSRCARGLRPSPLLPRLEKVDDYLDWRVAFAANSTGVHPNFDDAVLIVLGAWERVVGHVETAWQEHLLGSER